MPKDLKESALIVAATVATLGGLGYLGYQLTSAEDTREPVVCEVWHASHVNGPWTHLADVTSSNICLSIPGKTNFTLAWNVNMPLYSPGFTNQFYQVTNPAGFFRVRNRGVISLFHSEWNQ